MPSQMVLVLGIVEKGLGTIVIIFVETSSIPQAAYPVAVSVKVTVPVWPTAGT